MSEFKQVQQRIYRRNWRAMLLAIGLLASLNSALAGSKVAKPQVKVPRQWTTTDQAIATGSTEDISRWWERFGDARLSSLIERALKDSPDIHKAEAKLRESRARRQLASANRLPSATASGSTDRSTNSGIGSIGTTGTGSTTGSYSVSGDIGWDPDLNGAKRSAVKAATADYQATAADLQSTQVSLAAEVALNYVQLRAYQVRLEIARRNEATQSETLQIAGWREQAGLVSSVDVAQARANRDQTHAQIPALEANVAETQHTLELLAGTTPRSLGDELSGKATIPSPPDQIAVGIPANTLRQRPDVHAAEARIGAETARISQQQAARYPSVSLSASFGYQLVTGVLTGGSSTISSLISSVSQTLFDGGRIRHNVEIQSAVQQQAVVLYESTVLTALKEVENALVSFSKNRERLASLTTAADAARNAAQLAQNRYSAGLVDFTTVLDTERTHLLSKTMSRPRRQIAPRR